MPGEPSVLQSRQSSLVTATRTGKSDDRKANTFRIGKIELVCAFVLETIAFVGHWVETPRAEPVTCGVGNSRGRASLAYYCGSEYRFATV